MFSSAKDLADRLLASNYVIDETILSTTPDTAFRWSATDQQWIFNISTKNLAKSTTYGYTVTLNDDSTIEFRQSDGVRVPLEDGPVELAVAVASDASCRFSYSRAGATNPIGDVFRARPGLWVGARMGLFARGAGAGHADFEWFRVD